MNPLNNKICIVGLGYVGLPLAVAFAAKYKVTAFDINISRIKELESNYDKTLEIDSEILKSVQQNILYASDIDDVKGCNIYIITVPTPIDKDKKPDLKYLKIASKTVGKKLKKDDVVIYESTVYPGATEEYCAPILEKSSGLTLNEDFYCGYSPERVNPGDKKYTLEKIIKVTSGSTPYIATKIDNLYKEIITAGTYKAENIKVAEAAKVIENTQRDLNIALINEFSIIFNKLDINTESVLKAAATKWNFLQFKPGLVGGHCIGVDPYYLTYKAQEIGYTPKVILSGRKMNDDMGAYIADQVSALMASKSIHIVDSNILIMGLTFKENCPDIRNTMVANLNNMFEILNSNVDVYDPWVNEEDALEEYGIKLISYPIKEKYDAIILAVAHDDFKALSLEQIKVFGRESHVIFDVKCLLSAKDSDGRL
jgi:UDP-N-acetyl-D-galactosamine dehydrogenase